MSPAFKKTLAISKPVFACAMLLSIANTALAGGINASSNPTIIDSHTTRIIVKYKSNAATAYSGQKQTAAAEFVGRQHGVKLKELRRMYSGAAIMGLDSSVSEDQAKMLAAEISALDPNVDYAEPDILMNVLSVPNDTYFNQQWSLSDPTVGINAITAWDRTNGAGVTVAVLDTGYRPHTDLTGNILAANGYDFISDLTIANDGNSRDADASDPGDKCNDPAPSSWHGTHVAGTIAALANNNQGVAGVAYGAKILPIRVLGCGGGYMSDISDGIVWASGGVVSGTPRNTARAQVINLSLGGTGACSTTIQTAINTARANNTTIVVAAGNENIDAANTAPANCNGVITVAAINRNGDRASYSNFGTAVTLAAPGGEGGTDGIVSTLNDGVSAPGNDNYVYYAGTSMATPHVAGTIALMRAVDPFLSPDKAKTLLQNTARTFSGQCTGCGTGMLDANAAVIAAQKDYKKTKSIVPIVATIIMN
jgi:serine protease